MDEKNEGGNPDFSTSTTRKKRKKMCVFPIGKPQKK